MVSPTSLLLLLSTFALAAPPSPQGAGFTEPDPALQVSVELNGKSFINKGIVAFGLIRSNFTESTGDTLGGVGSAIAIKLGTFRKNHDGTFFGTLVVQPDRGFNVDGTVDYQGRQHDIDFVLDPYYGRANLSFSNAQKTLSVKYRRTLLYTERGHATTTGLDALGVRKAQAGFPIIAQSDPQVPIASPAFNHLSLDLEGLVLNSDGSFWVSDEYGPYVYKFDSRGQLLITIQPPNAILPQSNGLLNFTSETDPTTGRVGNQGFEGLSASPDGRTLYVLLQSATVQDGGGSKGTSRFTRLLQYDVFASPPLRPRLTGEWVVPLPQNAKGNTLAQSELHFISKNVFFVLARDGDGHGGDDNNSKYKQADLIDISRATDIHKSKFDNPANPIAVNGTLINTITPATYVGFVSLIDSVQLARFGLHNGSPADRTLIDAKWESLALAPVGDRKFPNDYFLFTAADNDFISTQGVFKGQTFNAGLDNDNQFLVFRVTLPTVSRGSIEQAIGIRPL